MNYFRSILFKNLKLQGIMVKFPVTPYRSQIEYMNALLRCLKSSGSGLLESPTGSGKSLALLGAALAFQNENKDTVTHKIYIATRTHSQIKQMIAEVKKFSAVYSIKATPLASRKQSCVHATISKSLNINEECRSAVNKGECRYYVKRTDLARAHALGNVCDVEEIVREGKNMGGCPYYAMKVRSEAAEVIITPYQYLLNPRYRKSLALRMKDSIVILDEAHNIENVCRDSVTNAFTIHEITALKAEVESLLESDYQASACTTVIHQIKTLLMWFNSQIHIIMDSTNKTTQEGKFYTGKELEGSLIMLGFDNHSQREFSAGVNSILNEDEDFDSISQKKDEENKDNKKLPVGFANTLENLNDALKLLFYNYSANSNAKKKIGNVGFDDFIVSIMPPTPEVLKLTMNKKRLKKDLFTVNFWCMNPGVAFNKLHEKCRSVILTSGTLSPMESFSSELGVDFREKISTPHVVSKEQYLVGSISTGLKGETFLGTYRNVDKLTYQDQLGGCIVEAATRLRSALPNGGVLVFLPSYGLLWKLKNRWNSTGLIKRLEGDNTNVFFEPKGTGSTFDDMIKKYRSACANQYGVLFAVCRGKASEGIDFSDELSRIVLVIGIPYASFGDHLVKKKMEWNDKCNRHKPDEVIKGRTWYELQAFRAVNQAAGRCIRHRLDFGAIVFVDKRFEGWNTRKQVSKWINCNFTDTNDTQKFFVKFEKFLKDAKKFTDEKRLLLEKRNSTD
eukprot:GAHX01002017.1.p1 GENE.GAHX01002017.1~~GAHX01002017.1.p1  ORF type:complete len:735 (-),score=136.31 GAHX01002017.1:52-2256(-)